MIEVNGVLVYNEQTANDLLYSLGMDKIDVENFARMLCEDEIEEAEYQRDVAKQEYEAMEAAVENMQSTINELMNMLDDALAMERISKPREKMEAMRRLIYNM